MLIAEVLVAASVKLSIMEWSSWAIHFAVAAPGLGNLKSMRNVLFAHN